MKFAFVHAEKASFTIAAMCRLFVVSRQGYYAYVKALRSPRLAEELALQAKIRTIHADVDGTYGSPRIHEELQKQGINVAKRRVERSMRALGICGVSRRRHQTTTRANPTHPVEANVLARDFTATRPNERWVTDITYVWTDEGWAYLAAILDLYSRAVVGWALSTSLSTELPLTALGNALRNRRPEAGLMHHSDRGCQYTSAEYRGALNEAGITVSMSRHGNCWDNAVAESFFATLKTELVYRRSWPTRIELRGKLFEYIETFYNRRRLHSTLDYKTPAEMETAYFNEAA
jgi:transposase InsO family protein